ncbi:MAG: hypothetical protein DI527_00560 [Chelatococcus sp.]|nr:MAG: hypothetical protein DI527_00560 [Chelatococcus sp.]
MFDLTDTGWHPVMGDVQGGAVFSECGRYRHELSRIWNRSKPWALWVGLNQSTANREVDDRTLKWETHYTYDVLQLGGLVNLNVFDIISNKPLEQFAVTASLSSARNIETITHFALKAHTVIVAWGAIPPEFKKQTDAVAKSLLDAGCNLSCLGHTLDGHPCLPLLVRHDTPLQRWPRRSQ